MPDRGELFVLFDRSGFVIGPFWTRAAVEQHLKSLGQGAGTTDNAHLAAGLEMKRYVIAALEAA